MILNFGGISGAHFNPAVTLAFSLRGVFPWTKVLTYWAVQIGGGIAGAAIVRGIFPDNPEDDYLGRPLAHYGWTTGLYVEILLTFVHILNILGTATRHQLIGTGTAFAVGAWVATSFLFTGPLSGAVLNPAIAFGAFVISGEWMYGWIYIVGEFAGSLLAIAVTWVIHPQVERVEKGVAEGAETEKDRHRGPEAA
jgi:aquaporin Z